MPPASGFNCPYTLSSELAAVVGVATASRPAVVKLLWVYIKEHDLQNPENKREIRNDEAMQAVFEKAEMDMFEMNKLLSKHLTKLPKEAEE